MRHYMSPASFKLVTILLAVMFLLGAGLGVVQYTSSLPKPGERLVEGRIIKIKVEQTTDSGSRFNRRPVVSYKSFLTINIVNTNTIVTTVVNGDWTNASPVVTFYYSGDPSKPVFLQQDTSTIRGVILFLLMALTVIVGLIGVLMFYQWGARIRQKQRQALLDSISTFEAKNPNRK